VSRSYQRKANDAVDVCATLAISIIGVPVEESNVMAVCSAFAERDGLAQK